MIYNKEKLEELRHRWTTPKGKQLIKIIKESRCYLSPVLFREKVRNFPGINDKELEDNIDLRGAPLQGFDFRVVIEEDDDFKEEIAILSNINFEGAILKYCNFIDAKIHNCRFENAELYHADFKNATLDNCHFQHSDCTGVSLQAANLINCNFADTTIKDMVLDSTIIDQKSTFGEILQSEKEGNFHFASIEYKQIKRIYRNSSLHNAADHYHYKEMVAKRKIASSSNPVRWLNYIFGDLLCKYGTSFVRVMVFSLLIILFCAILYTAKNGLYYQNTAIELNFFDSLYFSIVTFTTLGYGDYHAVGALRFLAATEAFIGAALMALFTVIVARILIRD